MRSQRGSADESKKSKTNNKKNLLPTRTGESEERWASGQYTCTYLTGATYLCGRRVCESETICVKHRNMTSTFSSFITGRFSSMCQLKM